MPDRAKKDRYFGKGRMIAVEGSLQKRSYDAKDGSKRWVTEVVVDSVSFTGERAQQNGDSSYSYQNRDSQQRSYAPPRQQEPQHTYNEPDNKPISIGEMGDFEDILSSDGVPF